MEQQANYLRLSELREAKKLNKTQLANISGVSRPYISQVEAGLYIPTVDVCCKLCLGLGCTPNDLIREEYYTR